MSSSLQSLAEGFREAAEALFNAAKISGANPRVTSTFRTRAQQQALYEAYTSGKARYPAAPPGGSAHEYGYAFDMVLDAPWQALAGQLWTQWGGKYGGEEDPIHFEDPQWRSFAHIVTTPSPSGFGEPGGRIYQLIDMFIGFFPAFRIIGYAQLAGMLSSVLQGHQDLVSFWLTHPAEAARDLPILAEAVAERLLGIG